MEFKANGNPLAPSEQLGKVKPRDIGNWNIIRIVRNGVPEADERSSMTILRR